MLHIVIPTRNEAPLIRSTIERLCAFMDQEIHEPWQIIIADNGSTDATRAIVWEMVTHEPRIDLLEIPETGKGLAVLTAWKSSSRRGGPHDRPREDIKSSPTTPTPSEEYEAFLFMDADLATDLEVLPKLIAAIRAGADIAIGSRYARGAHVERSITRRIISRGNQFLLKIFFGLRIADAPCGCKAVNERVVREIVPLVRDTQWFFDTELLIRAQRANMRITEIPVTWRETRRGDASMKILRIIARNLRAIAALRKEFA